MSEGKIEHSYLNKVPYIAAGMLQSDGKILPLWGSLLIVVHVLPANTILESRWSLLFFALLERSIELTFLYVVGRSWLKKLTHRAVTLPFKTGAAQLFSIGLAFWLSVAFPVLLASMVPNQATRAVLLVLLLGAIWTIYRHYFYFLPAMSSQGSYKQLLATAREYVRQDGYAPLRVLAAPFGLMAIYTASVTALAPDGRYLLLRAISELGSTIFWVSATYIGLAYAFLAMSAQQWRELELDPYRTARFETLRLQASPRLAHLLSTRSAVRMLLLGVIIWTTNAVRLMYIAPNPDITLRRMEIDDKNVILELTLADYRYRFRGFIPAHFMLAGEKQTPISEKMQASVLPSGEEVTYSFPSINREAVLQLNFTTARSGRALVELEDLYLWYRAVRLYRVDLQTERLIPVQKYR